jgi:aspartate 1-decarboxylase
MFIKLLKSKIHKATVTDARLHYPGSLAVDSKLMEAVGLMPYEAVIVADIDNGVRLETYIIPAEAGSGEVSVLGAAANLVKPKDSVIIFGFGLYSPEEAKKHKPKTIVLGENNKIVKVP